MEMGIIPKDFSNILDKTLRTESPGFSSRVNSNFYFIIIIIFLPKL